MRVILLAIALLGAILVAGCGQKEKVLVGTISYAGPAPAGPYAEGNDGIQLYELENEQGDTITLQYNPATADKKAPALHKAEQGKILRVRVTGDSIPDEKGKEIFFPSKIEEIKQ